MPDDRRHTTISLTHETKNDLKERKRGGESYSSVVQRLLEKTEPEPLPDDADETEVEA